MQFSITAKPFFNVRPGEGQVPPIEVKLVMDTEKDGQKYTKTILLPMHLTESQLDVMVDTAIMTFKNWVKQEYKGHFVKEAEDGQSH